MKKTLNILFTSLVLSACATRVTPPAQIVNVTSMDTLVSSVSSPTPTSTNSKATSNANQEVTVTPMHHNEQAVKNSSSSAKTAKVNPPEEAKTAAAANSEWMMPTVGSIGGAFSSTRKGIDIHGSIGQPIFAANDGKVVYSGNGLKGYGNLIIIKHSNNYLTAYAHNKVNLVHDGDIVKRGQKIAQMGENNGKAMLHFEVRKNGKPIDPSSLIGG